VVRYLDWILDLGFASRIILSVKVKVLGGGFGLWLGDNISILSMVKRAHLLFLTVAMIEYPPNTDIGEESTEEKGFYAF
jgi:hypothetical protein